MLEYGFEGLVVEYGYVLVIMLNYDSNCYLRKCGVDGKMVILRKIKDFCLILRLIFFLKYLFDFFKSG